MLTAYPVGDDGYAPMVSLDLRAGAAQCAGGFRDSRLFYWLPLIHSVDGITVMFKSTDSVTWTAMDASSGPIASRGFSSGARNCGAYWDGADLVTAVGLDSSNTPYLQDFDLVTGVWGSPYAGGGAITVSDKVSGLLKRGGDWILLFTGEGGAAVVHAGIFSAGSWTDVDLGPNRDPGSDMPSCGACIDVDGNIYIMAGQSGGSFGAVALFQRMNADNSLGDWANFFDTDFSNGIDWSNWFASNPTAIGTDFLFAVSLASVFQPALLKGTPLVSPTFTLGAAIDGPYSFEFAPFLGPTATSAFSMKLVGGSVWTPTFGILSGGVWSWQNVSASNDFRTWYAIGPGAVPTAVLWEPGLVPLFISSVNPKVFGNEFR